MKRWLSLCALPVILGVASPAPLVVGAIRDQHGAPIPGATVSIGTQKTAADANGTFAISPPADSGVLVVSCPYCRKTSIRFTAGEPVVAIVERYQAVALKTPSDADLASVPYSRLPQAASLAPFTVLNDSRRVLPGPRVSNRGASAQGGLVFDDGIAAYDISANASPFLFFGVYDTQSADVEGSASAFRYGDQAGGGIIAAQSQAFSGWAGAALLGSQSAIAITQGTQPFSFNVAGSQDDVDARRRADATYRFPLGTDTLSFTGLVASDRLEPQSESLDSNMNALRVRYDGGENSIVHAEFDADRSGYDATIGANAINAEWTDAQLEAGVATRARDSGFFEAAVRTSTGYYDASQANFPPVAGTIVQSRVDAGVRTQGDGYEFHAGAGAFSVDYGGGPQGASTPMNAQFVVPSIGGSIALSKDWDLAVDADGSFRLPTLLESFAYEPMTPALAFDRNSALTTTLSYTDWNRVRLDATVFSQRVTGLDNGMVHSGGVSMAWQVAPALSLRAWFLHFDDETVPLESIVRFGARPQPATVGSYWLSYETLSGFRIDAIYRQDLLDYDPNPHFDASVSAPLGRGLRWFAATEQRDGKRYVGAGLRLGTP